MTMQAEISAVVGAFVRDVMDMARRAGLIAAEGVRRQTEQRPAAPPRAKAPAPPQPKAQPVSATPALARPAAQPPARPAPKSAPEHRAPEPEPVKPKVEEAPAAAATSSPMRKRLDRQ